MADAIKKPIIPLLLEPMSWPPEGPMSLIFAQLLYIDFCQPNTDIQRNWNCPQFDQLINKIKEHVEVLVTVRIRLFIHFICHKSDTRLEICSVERGICPMAKSRTTELFQ